MISSDINTNFDLLTKNDQNKVLLELFQKVTKPQQTLFFQQSINTIIKSSWKLQNVHPISIISTDPQVEYKKKYNDAFSQAMMNIFAPNTRTQQSFRRKLVRHAIYYLNKSFRLRSLFAEPLGASVLNCILTQSNASINLLNSKSTTNNALEYFKKLPQPKPNDDFFRIQKINKKLF